MSRLAAALAIPLFLLSPLAAAKGDCDKSFAALAAARNAADSSLVNVILSLGFKGISLDEASAQVQARRYQKLYPKERTVVISARSEDELRSRSAGALKPGERIHRLFVDSHGMHSDITYGVFNIVFLDDKQPFLQGPGGFTRALDAFKNRFAPDALITFEGCDLLPKEDNESAEIMSQLLVQFGMASGRVYANYSKGTNMQDDFIHPRFSDLHDWKSCAMVGAANALLPVSELFSGIFDYAVANRGYLYTRVGATQWCLDHARMMDMRD